MSDCPVPPGQEPTFVEITWTPEALERLQRAPLLLRGMVRKLAERRARQEGITTITHDVMTRYKNEMMGIAASGEYRTGEKLGLRWTEEAEALLARVPEFMRPLTRRITEELALELEAREITPELIARAEALSEEEGRRESMPWAPEAEAQLAARLGRAPAMMADFVLRLFKRDAEAEARRRGYSSITAEVFQKVWYAGLEEHVEWEPEAWARLQTAPDFVRTGIQKVAERRARKMGVRVITSPLLTKFRNQAMMKAVRRIRELGFSELTFDAFDAAKEEMRIVSLNPEAHDRLGAIRRYFAEERTRGHGDILGEDLMRRFREYLKDPSKGSLDTDEQDP